MSAGERWRICPCSTASLSTVKSFSAYPGWTTLCTNQELSVSFRRGTKLANGETTTSRCSDLCFLAIHPASTNYWLYSESLNKPLTRPLERTAEIRVLQCSAKRGICGAVDIGNARLSKLARLLMNSAPNGTCPTLAGGGDFGPSQACICRHVICRSSTMSFIEPAKDRSASVMTSPELNVERFESFQTTRLLSGKNGE